MLMTGADDDFSGRMLDVIAKELPEESQMAALTAVVPAIKRPLLGRVLSLVSDHEADPAFPSMLVGISMIAGHGTASPELGAELITGSVRHVALSDADAAIVQRCVELLSRLPDPQVCVATLFGIFRLIGPNRHVAKAIRGLVAREFAAPAGTDRMRAEHLLFMLINPDLAKVGEYDDRVSVDVMRKVISVTTEWEWL